MSRFVKVRVGRDRGPRKAGDGLWFGLALMVFGVIFLLDRLDVVDLGGLGAWWPLIPITFGAVRILTWQSADSVGSGVTLTLMGLWMWASVEGWYGLSWRNSWPLALAAIGTGMVAKSLLTPVFHEDKAVDEEEGGHHGA